MDTFPDALGIAALGIASGFAVAVPLGPIGLLILDRGLAAGRRPALAAAAGVATVDTAYAILAVLAAGVVAGPIEAVRGPVALVGAVVLVGLAVRGLREAMAALPSSLVEETAAAHGVGRTFAAFVGLTLINPTTVLSFVAVAVGAADRLVDATTRVVFVVAVTAASLVWQVGLALAGSALGAVPRPKLRGATRAVGAAALLALAAALAADGFSQLTA